MLTATYLMFMGICNISSTTNCNISNTTNCNNYHSLFLDDELHDEEFNLPAATRNSKLEDKKLSPEIMKVTTLDMPPYSSIYELNGKIIGNVTSDAFYIFDLISKKLNITYEIVMPDQKILGDLRNGVIGMLNEGKVDMAVAYLPINPDLHSHVSYSPMLTQIELKALMTTKDHLAIETNILNPLTDNSYKSIPIAIAFILSGLFFFATIYLRSCLWKHTKIDNYTFLQSAWFIYGTSVGQGSAMTPKTGSIRVLFGSWWIFIMIFTSLYTANVFVVLRKPEFTLPYHSLTDIVKSHKNWSSTKEHYIEYALNQSKTEEFEKLKTSFEKGYGDFIDKPSDKEIFDSVYNDSKIYLGDGNHLKRMIVNDYLDDVRKNKPMHKRCKYVIMPETIYKQPVAFAYPKGSKYQKKFDKLLRNLVAAGIFKHLERRKLPAMDYCPLEFHKYMIEKLRKTDLSLAFKILAGGLTLATLVFILENIGFHLLRIYKKYRNNRKPALTRNHTQILPFVHRVNNYFDDHPSTSNSSPTHQSNGANIKIIYNRREYLEMTNHLEAND